jgi:hypothetical protein
MSRPLAKRSTLLPPGEPKRAKNRSHILMDLRMAPTSMTAPAQANRRPAARRTGCQVITRVVRAGQIVQRVSLAQQSVCWVRRRSGCTLGNIFGASAGRRLLTASGIVRWSIRSVFLPPAPTSPASLRFIFVAILDVPIAGCARGFVRRPYRHRRRCQHVVF